MVIVNSNESKTGLRDGSKITAVDGFSQKLNKLIDAHWSYIEALLITHGQDDQTIKEIGFHYRTAFRHGYKHAKEESVMYNYSAVPLYLKPYGTIKWEK
jgi:hypothetical protein